MVNYSSMRMLYNLQYLCGPVFFAIKSVIKLLHCSIQERRNYAGALLHYALVAFFAVATSLAQNLTMLLNEQWLQTDDGSFHLFCFASPSSVFPLLPVFGP